VAGKIAIGPLSAAARRKSQRPSACTAPAAVRRCSSRWTPRGGGDSARKTWRTTAAVNRLK